jgi:hypothetical protein
MVDFYKFLIDICTTLSPVFLAIIAAVGPFLLLRAKTAANNAIEAKDVAASTSSKIDAVGEQLNGRLTEYKLAMADSVKAALSKVDAALAKVDAAFERGRGVGHDEAVLGPIATSVSHVEDHLTKQDEVLTELHQVVVKNGPPKNLEEEKP